MKDGSGESTGIYSITFNGQLVYIIENTKVQPMNNLKLSLGDPYSGTVDGDPNSKIRNIVIAEVVKSNDS